jgi:N-acetyl-alpha-D-muramate 1-phosphate uridylyltransferase
MIFAAGFGTRMGALTADRPKPLIPVAGKALIDHALDTARGASDGPIVVNTHYKAGMMAAHLAPQNVTVSPEQPEILDTGGGLRKALPLLGDGPVMTLNSDAIFTGPNPLAALAAAWDPDIMDAILLCVPPERAVGRVGGGDFAITAGRLSRGGPLVYCGAQILNPALLGEIPETVFSLNLLWDRMIARGRLHGLIHSGQWCDVGRPEGITLAEETLAAADV